MNLTTLTYDEFEHVQLRQHMANWVWSKGVADRNMQFIALVALFKLQEDERRYVFPPSRICSYTSISL